MQKQAGQVLLIVVLVTIVASTIGLSIATRSITSLKSSTEEAESQKALAAAEAGIERAIQGNVPIESLSDPNVLDSEKKENSSYSTVSEPVQTASFLLNGGNIVPKDEGADIWFVKHNSNGSLDYSSLSPPFAGYINLYWGSSSESCSGSNPPAAIQAIVVSKEPSSGEIKSYRYAYDSSSASCSSRISENKFTTADSVGGYIVPGIPGITFQNKTPDLASSSHLAGGVSNIVFIRVIPIYKDAVIGVRACKDDNTNCTNSLPSQGYKITSTGKAGQANRKLTVFKGYPQTYLPYLSYGLFVAK